jgi:hypothetical protein
MAGTTIVQSGNYSLEIDAGFNVDGFTLDDTTKGVLNNTSYVLDGTTQWADVTSGTLSIRCVRGRRDIGDQFTYGTMTFVLNDTLAGGIFNPFDTSSPYYNQYTDTPGLAPLRGVRLARYDLSNNKKYLFIGKIVNYDYTFNLGGIDTISVSCADDFYVLAQTSLTDWNVTEQLSSDRVTELLDRTEVAYPTGVAHRNIGTGTVTLGGSAAYTVTNGTSAAVYANQINLAEQGRIFISRDGVFTFQPRIGNTLAGSVADFHDDGTAIGYQGVGIVFQADQVKNRAVIQHAGAATPEIAEDLVSQTKYLIQAISISDSLVHNDASALELANYLLVPDPEARFSDLEATFASMTTTQRDSVAIVDIGDTITIQKSIETGSTSYQLAQELSVEGIEHQINFTNGHQITFYTTPTTIVYELILNSATYGTLDALNALG